MATYEKMVLISEAEYMNLKNYKYLPHEIEGDDGEESGYDDGGESGYDDSGYDDDDDDDESGYRPGRIWRQPQTPDDRHIQTPSSSVRSSPTFTQPTRRFIDSPPSAPQSSASSARSSMSSGDARARAEAAQRIEEQRIQKQRIEELRRAEETAQRM